MTMTRGLPAALAGVATGALTWSATEYVMHRWVLHGPFGHGRLAKVPLGSLHRLHHREPDATSMVARAAGHLAIASGAVAATALVGPRASIAFVRAGAAAWSAGYSNYELRHWNAHHREPRTAAQIRVRDRHFRHHFGAPRSNFGVTMSWFDHVFGTEAPPAAARRVAADV